MNTDSTETTVNWVDAAKANKKLFDVIEHDIKSNPQDWNYHNKGLEKTIYDEDDKPIKVKFTLSDDHVNLWINDDFYSEHTHFHNMSDKAVNLYLSIVDKIFEIPSMKIMVDNFDENKKSEKADKTPIDDCMIDIQNNDESVLIDENGNVIPYRFDPVIDHPHADKTIWQKIADFFKFVNPLA